MKKQYIILGLVATMMQFAQAQFTLDGEFRPRAEYRNGFGSLIADNAEPGFGISTRARLNAGFKTETYKVYLSLQDVFVWGEKKNPQDSVVTALRKVKSNSSSSVLIINVLLGLHPRTPVATLFSHVLASIFEHRQ